MEKKDVPSISAQSLYLFNDKLRNGTLILIPIKI